MKRLSGFLRERRGTTLAEVMCAGLLTVMFIDMCAAALYPAAKAVRRLRQISEAEIIADSILESVCAEVEEAREYVRVCRNDGEDMNGGVCEGEVLEFVGRGGLAVRISAASGLEPEGLGRLWYHYSVTNSEGGGNAILGKTLTCVEDAVFPEEFYTGLYLKLRFLPILEDGMLTRIKITVQLGDKLERSAEGPVIQNIICTRSATAGLRRAVELRNGVLEQAGLPLNAVAAEVRPPEERKRQGTGR